MRPFPLDSSFLKTPAPMVGIIGSCTNLKLGQFFFVFEREHFVCTFFGQWGLIFQVEFVLWRLSGIEAEISILEFRKEINHDFWRFFTGKLFSYRNIFLFYAFFFQFSHQPHQLQFDFKIWVSEVPIIPEPFSNFWPPADPGSSPWGIKMFTTQFCKFFLTI